MAALGASGTGIYRVQGAHRPQSPDGLYDLPRGPTFYTGASPTLAMGTLNCSRPGQPAVHERRAHRVSRVFCSDHTFHVSILALARAVDLRATGGRGGYARLPYLGSLP